MNDDRHQEIEQRVQHAIDREVSRLEVATETLRSRHVAADAALEAARDHADDTWRRYERTHRRRHYYAWQNAQTERDRAEDELRQVLFELRRAGRRHQELTSPVEFRRRVQLAERRSDLRDGAAV